MSLESQYIVVLDGTICLSVQLGDNSKLVLKMYFQFFTLSSKKVQGFSRYRKTLMLLLSALSSTKLSQFFEFLIFSQYI